MLLLHQEQQLRCSLNSCLCSDDTYRIRCSGFRSLLNGFQRRLRLSYTLPHAPLRCSPRSVRLPHGSRNRWRSACILPHGLPCCSPWSGILPRGRTARTRWWHCLPHARSCAKRLCFRRMPAKHCRTLPRYSRMRRTPRRESGCQPVPGSGWSAGPCPSCPLFR